MRTQTLVLAVALVAFAAPSATAQAPAARSINPEAVEFDTPVTSTPGVTGFVVEIFVATADPERDAPVTAKTLGRDALQRTGIVRVELKDLVLGIPDGRYMATLRTEPSVGAVRSEPSDPFLIRQAGTPQDRQAEASRERFWTKVGVAIGAGLLLVPLLF